MNSSKAESASKIDQTIWAEYFDHTVHQIKFYDAPANNRALSLVDGNHCAAQLRLCKRSRPHECQNVWLENGATVDGKASFYIEKTQPKQYDNRNEIVGIRHVNIPFRNMYNAISALNGTKYNCITNNCYNINSKLCEYLGEDEGAKELKRREDEISRTSLNNSAILGGAALGVLYGVASGGILGIGLWGLANTTLYAKRWKKPQRLQEKQTLWFGKSKASNVAETI